MDVTPAAQPARREDALRLIGSGGANAAMERELLRLVKRSPFDMRLDRPKRDGDAMLLYAFEPRVAFVAACYHRTSSRLSWDLWSSPATRLEPLHADLAPLVAADERIDSRRPLSISVDVGPLVDFEAGPLQVRGTVKNAILDGLARRGIRAEVDAEQPDAAFSVRRVGPDGARRTMVGVDLGDGARHRRGHRVAAGDAPLRETLAAQLVALSRWAPHAQPLVDPMAGGGTIAIEAAHLALGTAVRTPDILPRRAFPCLADLPTVAPALYPGTVPRILACDVNAERIPAMVANLRAAGLTGPEAERAVTVAQADARELTPQLVERLLPRAEREWEPGVFAFNPPYGHRVGAPGGEAGLISLYRDTGRALSRFPGWHVAVFVANRKFLEVFDLELIMKKPASNAELPGYFLLYKV